MSLSTHRQLIYTYLSGDFTAGHVPEKKSVPRFVTFLHQNSLIKQEGNVLVFIPLQLKIDEAIRLRQITPTCQQHVLCVIFGARLEEQICFSTGYSSPNSIEIYICMYKYQ